MMSTTDPAWEAALKACQALRTEGGTVDDMLLLLRRAGCWKVESIRALMALEGTTFVDAKAAVHLSPVWADCCDGDETLHDQVEEELKVVGESRPSPTHANLVVLVERLLRAEFEDKGERDEILEALHQHVQDPEVTDYIFAPDRAMTAADIVERALAYRPRAAHAPAEP